MFKSFPLIMTYMVNYIFLNKKGKDFSLPAFFVIEKKIVR